MLSFPILFLDTSDGELSPEDNLFQLLIFGAFESESLSFTRLVELTILVLSTVLFVSDLVPPSTAEPAPAGRSKQLGGSIGPIYLGPLTGNAGLLNSHVCGGLSLAYGICPLNRSVPGPATMILPLHASRPQTPGSIRRPASTTTLHIRNPRDYSVASTCGRVWRAP